MQTSLYKLSGVHSSHIGYFAVYHYPGFYGIVPAGGTAHAGAGYYPTAIWLGSFRPFQHLMKTVSTPDYLKGFGAIALLATGGFMLMPFASAFTVYNLGISLDHLPMIYMTTGICSMIAGPLAGKLSDQLGKYKVFLFVSLITMIVVAFYCNLGITPLWIVLAANIVMFVGVTSRMVSASALMTAIPGQPDRGAFMGIQSSVQQISGGLASVLAGLIVVQTSSGVLENYDILAYVVVLVTIVTMAMMYVIDQLVKQKMNKKIPNPPMVPV